MFEQIPNFFILGAAKAGTTSLSNILLQHPQIFITFIKETLYFSRDEFYDKGIEWYTSNFFQDAAGFPLRGEATPHYLYWAEKVAPRIKNLYENQEVKFIVILRNPVKRAYSWYWNMVRDGREKLPYAIALEKETERLRKYWKDLYTKGSMSFGYYRGGCYANQLKTFFRYFSPEQFYIMLQEDLKELEHEKLLQLLEFLGADPNFQFKPVHSNPAALPLNQSWHNTLVGPSALKTIIKKILPTKWRFYLKNTLTKVNLREVDYPELSEALESSLRARYRNEVDDLETLIGRDLSHWKPLESAS